MTVSKFSIKTIVKSILSAEKGFTADFQNSITKLIPAKIGEVTNVSYEVLELVANEPEESNYNTEEEYQRNLSQYEKIVEDASPMELRQAKDAYAKLKEICEQYPQVYLGITKLRSCISGVGIHAAGVVISSKEISSSLPIMKGSDTAVLPVLQLDMHAVTFFNALKLDILGLKLLSIIQYAMKFTNLGTEWYDKEDFNDVNVYKFLKDGNTTNVFQMWKSTPTRMLYDFDVSDLNGISAVNACNRPGPLAKGSDGMSVVDHYAENTKNGVVTKLDPRIDWILEPTRGCIVFQEQCQFLGQVMAGYSLSMSDLRIRKVIGKKLLEKIPEIRCEFIYGLIIKKDEDGKPVLGEDPRYPGSKYVMTDERSQYCVGAINNGFTEELAVKIFDIMEAFASYAFNKAHSSSYGVLSYRSAYLSLYHPSEWSTACLIGDVGKKDAIIRTLNDCKRRGLKLLPPDINQSGDTFSVVNYNGEKTIRFGFVAIDKVGENISKAITTMRDIGGEFTSFQNFLDRAFDTKSNELIETHRSLGKVVDGKITKNVFMKTNVISLIKCGAFDSLEPDRHKLIKEYGIFKRESFDEYNVDFKLCYKLQYELELLGSYISQHPLENTSVFPYVDLHTTEEGKNVNVSGIVRSFTKQSTKTGKPMWTLKMETKDGSEIKCSIWENVKKKIETQLKGLSSKAKEGREIVRVEGKWSKQYNSITVSNIERFVKNSLKDNSVEEDEVIEDDILDDPVIIRQEPLEDFMMQF